MLNVLIVFAPENQDFYDIAGRMKAEFSQAEFSVVIKPAAKAIIPDIAASDLIIFGSGQDGKTVIHKDFDEINRALAGINLAGRTAGLFSLNSAEIIQKFKRILKDSDITVLNESLVLNTSITQNAIKNWISNLIITYKEGLDE